MADIWTANNEGVFSYNDPVGSPAGSDFDYFELTPHGATAAHVISSSTDFAHSGSRSLKYSMPTGADVGIRAIVWTPLPGAGNNTNRDFWATAYLYLPVALRKINLNSSGGWNIGQLTSLTDVFFYKDLWHPNNDQNRLAIRCVLAGDTIAGPAPFSTSGENELYTGGLGGGSAWPGGWSLSADLVPGVWNKFEEHVICNSAASVGDYQFDGSIQWYLNEVKFMEVLNTRTRGEANRQEIAWNNYSQVYPVGGSPGDSSAIYWDDFVISTTRQPLSGGGAMAGTIALTMGMSGVPSGALTFPKAGGLGGLG